MTEIASLIACAILLGLAVFQTALIFGAPIGRFAWGGQHDVLPNKLRIGSVVSIFLYIVFAVIILAKAGLISTPLSASVVSVGMWILTGYFFIGIVMNGISRSNAEKTLMTPVAATLAILFLVVAVW